MNFENKLYGNWASLQKGIEYLSLQDSIAEAKRYKGDEPQKVYVGWNPMPPEKAENELPAVETAFLRAVAESLREDGAVLGKNTLAELTNRRAEQILDSIARTTEFGKERLAKSIA